MKVLVDFEKLCEVKDKYDDFVDFCRRMNNGELTTEEENEERTKTVAGIQASLQRLFKESE